MGRPRMIIVVRHAQSEGNRNRSIHQTVPDHRVKLTTDGWAQAEEAGRRLRSMLRPDDTLQFYTSPYRRTRETTDGILRTLTSDDPSPSPFPRHTIKVWEEPRIREQDFGNFQPCSSAMERMWQERADYGHFFYRIPHGESAADAYDRISGFNESLWRNFEEVDFPSVCVLVTHGLMTRVFLMKWYHWSVEYFEDLRNVNHCEFVVMQRNPETGKYVLQNELRTWSELKRKVVEEKKQKGIDDAPVPPPVPQKRWGGCPEGCSHGKDDYPKRPKRQDTIVAKPQTDTTSTHALAKPEVLSTSSRAASEEDEEAFPHESSTTGSNAATKGTITTSDLPQRLRDTANNPIPKHLRPRPQWLQAGRDFGGSESGMATPASTSTEPISYGFPDPKEDAPSAATSGKQGGRMHSRTPSAQEAKWVSESGMGTGARADALGDQGPESENERSGSETEELKKATKEERADKSLHGSVY